MRDFLIGWVDDIFGEGLFDSVESVLSMNPSNGDFASVWSIVNTLYNNVCVPIAMGLVLIYFMVNLIEKSTQQQSLDLEHIIKLLLKLIIGLYFIEHGLELMASIYGLGFSFLNSIIGHNNAGDIMPADIKANVWKELADENINENIDWGVLDTIGKGLTILLELVFPWLCTIVMKVVINFVCYTRLIEFYIKTITAPIALSDFFTEGVHGNGWKFIKGYIAIALQAGVIMLAVVVFNGIADGIVEGAGDGYWAFLIKYLALGFATIGIMIKSLSLTKEVVGAQ